MWWWNVMVACVVVMVWWCDMSMRDACTHKNGLGPPPQPGARIQGGCSGHPAACLLQARF